jgi:hypothetical protein
VTTTCAIMASVHAACLRAVCRSGGHSGPPDPWRGSCFAVHGSCGM